MKKELSSKYPNSANLFQFCRKVLDHKYGGVRIIDQDVGQILGFDPADCSHWKKGKKNIRSIQAMKSISEHLDIDERLVVDIASGELDDIEGFHEYTGYGHSKIDRKLFDAARKEFYRQNASTWTRDKESKFKESFEIHEAKIDKIVAKIHAKVDFSEAPLYLPEIAAAYPEIHLFADESLHNDAPVGFQAEKDGWAISFPASDKMRPYMRFQIARAVGFAFFEKEGLPSPSEIGDYQKHVRDVQANLFAAKLLAPAGLIRSELAQVNVGRDIITQLADIFWVSKIFMNKRLKEILQYTPQI